MGMREKCTLWLLENSLVNTSLQGAVEERIEHLALGDLLVVGGDIFLECRAAGGCVRDGKQRRVEGIEVARLEGINRTWNPCAEEVVSQELWHWRVKATYILQVDDGITDHV